MKKEVYYILSKEKSSVYQHEEGSWPFTDQWREFRYLPTWRKKFGHILSNDENLARYWPGKNICHLPILREELVIYQNEYRYWPFNNLEREVIYWLVANKEFSSSSFLDFFLSFFVRNENIFIKNKSIDYIKNNFLV